MTPLSLDTWLEFATKGAFVLAAAAAAAWMLRWRSAATRHLVWASALGALVALPVAARVVPRVTLPVLPATASASSQVEPGIQAPRARVQPPAGEARSLAAAARPAGPTSRGPVMLGPATIVLGLWVIGVVALVTRTLVGVLTLRRLIRSAHDLRDPRWRDHLDVAAGEIACTRNVRLLASPGVTVPITCGVLSPSILVPESAVEWDDARVRVVLLHELAHIRRHDCLVQLVAQCAVACHWVNPLAWLAATRLRAERERACDDLVLAAGMKGSDYAEHLLDIARQATGSPAFATTALAMARPSELEGRLLAVLDRTRVRGVAGRRLVVATLAAAASTVSLVAAVTLEPVTGSAGPQVAVAAEALQAQPTPPTPAPTPAPQPQPKPRPSQGEPGGVSAGVPGGVRGGVAGGAPGPQHAQRGAGGAVSPAVRENVIQALVAALKDESPDVRQQAIHTLLQLGSPALFDPMVAALGDVNADVRQAAAMALAQMGDARAAAPLTRALGDTNADVRQQAAFGLGQVHATAAVPALGKALADEDAEVRQQAAFALGQIGDRAAVPGLSKALGDADSEVRQQAAFALGQIGDPGAVDVLTRALKDGDAEVRQQAAFALGQLLGRADGDEPEVAGKPEKREKP